MAGPSKPKGGRWCLVTNRHNWRILAERGFWTFARDEHVRFLRPGDEAVVYLTKNGGPSAFGGVVRFLGPQAAPKESPAGAYKHIIGIEVQLALENPVPVEEVRSQLQFLPQHNRWGSALQGRPILPLPAPDFLLLVERMQRVR